MGLPWQMIKLMEVEHSTFGLAAQFFALNSFSAWAFQFSVFAWRLLTFVNFEHATKHLELAQIHFSIHAIRTHTAAEGIYVLCRASGSWLFITNYQPFDIYPKRRRQIKDLCAECWLKGGGWGGSFGM